MRHGIRQLLHVHMQEPSKDLNQHGLYLRESQPPKSMRQEGLIGGPWALAKSQLSSRH